MSVTKKKRKNIYKNILQYFPSPKSAAFVYSKTQNQLNIYEQCL